MNTNRLVTTTAFVILAAASALAQTRPGAPASTPATAAPAANAQIPESKIALINSEAFLSEKEGIARLVAAAKKIEAEFEPHEIGDMSLIYPKDPKELPPELAGINWPPPL